MAVDEQQKRRDMAREILANTKVFIDALSRAAVLRTRAIDAGLVFIDGDFTDQDGLKHIVASDFSALLDQLDYTDNTALAGWMLTGSPTPSSIIANCVPQ